MGKFQALKKIRINNYFREVSVVIIGVAVTLLAGTIVNNIKETKDLNLQLALVHAELEDNLIRIDKVLAYYETHLKLGRFLAESLENPRPDLNDSINRYKKTIGIVIPFAYKRGAYDMFLNSGAMKLLTDRKQLLNITESYALLEEAVQEHVQYSESKMHILRDLNDVDSMVYSEGIDLFSPFYRKLANFYIGTNLMEVPFIEAKQNINKVLGKKRN